MIKATAKFGDKEWSVSWDPRNNEIEYMIAQFAFEARRVAERYFQGNS